MWLPTRPKEAATVLHRRVLGFRYIRAISRCVKFPFSGHSERMIPDPKSRPVVQKRMCDRQVQCRSLEPVLERRSGALTSASCSHPHGIA
jgi:hypothetical protein